MAERAIAGLREGVGFIPTHPGVMTASSALPQGNAKTDPRGTTCRSRALTGGEAPGADPAAVGPFPEPT